MKSLELFAGGGGLALGVEQGGFRHVALVERDHDSCETLRANSKGACVRRNWPVYELDVERFQFSRWIDQIDLLAAGPPCQPLSIAGKHAGDVDKRNLFPEVFRAVRSLHPQAVLTENVNGLNREAFKPYLDYTTLQLRYPTIISRPHENWSDHKERLAISHAHAELEYHVFGPQIARLTELWSSTEAAAHFLRRAAFDTRCFMGVARADSFRRGASTYQAGQRLLIRSGMRYPRPEAPTLAQRKVVRLKALPKPTTLAWRTVRDALENLPEAVDNLEHPTIANHLKVFQARECIMDTAAVPMIRPPRH